MSKHQAGDRLVCSSQYGRAGQFDDRRTWFTLGQSYTVIETGPAAAFVMDDNGLLAVAPDVCFEPAAEYLKRTGQ